MIRKRSAADAIPEEEIEEKSLRPHCEVLHWEDIYSDWLHDDLKYYWKRNRLTFSQWDESIRWQKERICD